MNNKIEIALMKHIERIKKDIAERDPNSVWDKEKSKIDYKNIASLHEGRVPLYSDHGAGLPEAEMFEFDNLRSL
tara:strand:- start:600 stop:821 length:222 start_codon:yes stop_codon:yes gene_type:complete